MPEVIVSPILTHTPHVRKPAVVKNPYFSKAVGKAFELLKLLEESGTPLHLSELAQRVKLTKSSAFRMLYTLEALHLLRRDDMGRYLTVRRMDAPLSEQFIPRLREAAVAPMRRLSMEFRETISLATLLENRIEVVEVLDSPHLVRMSNVVGRILPPHASSMGKAITAFQSAETRERLLTSYGFTIYTPNTISDQRCLEENFEKIRATGVSCDDEENTLGGFCYGAPILQPEQKVQAAISLSMVKTRLPQDHTGQQKIIDALLRAAAEIALQLQ